MINTLLAYYICAFITFILWEGNLKVEDRNHNEVTDNIMLLKIRILVSITWIVTLPLIYYNTKKYRGE